MSWRNIRLILVRELRDQLRDRRTLFMITVLPVLLYPMLGLGIVEMMLTFSEQPRTVVVLNADQLPDQPPFLDRQGILKSLYQDGQQDAERLRVVTDLPGAADEQPLDAARGERSSAELLTVARDLESRIHKLQKSERKSSGDQADQPADQPTEKPVDAAAPADDHPSPSQAASTVTAEPASLKSAQQELTDIFLQSGIQVLIIVPRGYGEALTSLQTRIAERQQILPEDVPPRISVVRNSADDKSLMAFARVKNALTNWEDAIRDQSFRKASLPAELHHPARLAWLEVAQEDQVSANVWSKLFPAMLVVMALTGAFYPAIDLGAGEKERGTMETLLISPAKRVELVMGKFITIMLFSIGTALLNLVSIGFTGNHMASLMGSGMPNAVSLELPPTGALIWLVLLLIPLAALFSALCLALATFARSTKEGQYYLTPLLMVVMGMTMFCMSPAVEMIPLYSVLPVVNVALLLKGMLLASGQSSDLVVYAIPVLASSIGYSILALWWAIELYGSEDVLFREAEKLDLRHWLKRLLRTKDVVPAFPEGIFCFIMILLLQFVAMRWMQPDLQADDAGRTMMRALVVQQLAMIACPAVFMGVLLTTSLRATFRLRMPSLSSMAIGAGLACVIHPLSLELSHFLVSHNVFPPLPAGAQQVMSLIRTDDQPRWLLIVVFALTPAICEELAFRGFILSGLARGGRLAIAIAISSVMFGIIHMIPQQAFNAALLGLILGLLAVYSRSLFPAMAFHFLNNTIATFHTAGFGGITADGVFLSRDSDGTLRYQLPLLIICTVIGLLLIIHMVRAVIREQDLKRRGLIPRYTETPAEILAAARASARSR
jgi:sodium transport system permease protein